MVFNTIVDHNHSFRNPALSLGAPPARHEEGNQASYCVASEWTWSVISHKMLDRKSFITEKNSFG